MALVNTSETSKELTFLFIFTNVFHKTKRVLTFSLSYTYITSMITVYALLRYCNGQWNTVCECTGKEHVCLVSGDIAADWSFHSRQLRSEMLRVWFKAKRLLWRPAGYERWTCIRTSMHAWCCLRRSDSIYRYANIVRNKEITFRLLGSVVVRALDFILIERSRVRLLASALPGSLGQLSLPSLRDRQFEYHLTGWG